MVGVGWSLSGLSEISRVHYGNGINFDANDTFAHSDAGVLMLQAEPQPQDPAGTDSRATYRSKKASFIRFQSFGNCAGGDPCYWIARDRSGTRYYYGEYGGSGNARLLTPDNTHIKTWALQAVVDLFENAYTINYTQDPANGRIYPNS